MRLLLLLALLQSTTWGGTGSSTSTGTATTTVTSRQWLFLMGDSVTCCYTWPAQLQQSVTPQPWILVNSAISGRSTQTTVNNLVATLAITNITDIPRVLINLSVNDFSQMGVGGFEATWKANYLTIIDALRVKWPLCPIYITRPWMRDFDTQADTMAGWIDYIVTQRSLVYLGTDERVFYKGSDNGATNTTDGIHPSTAGDIAIAAAQKAILYP